MRLYRWLLQLYPAAFRREFGEEMAEVFSQRLAAAHGQLAWLRLFGREAAGLATEGVRQHAGVLHARSARLARMGAGSALLVAAGRPPRVIALLLAGLSLAAGAGLLYATWLAASDLLNVRGPFHNTSTIADLDSDGDLDVLVVNVRRESETTSWSQVTLWTNEGGRFTPEVLRLPPYLYLGADAGDLDGDGDADLVLLAAVHLMFRRNAEGAEGGPGGLSHPFTPIYPEVDPGTPGSILLGDLDGDGDLDAFVAGCCGMLLAHKDGHETYLPSLAWTWMNEWDARRWRNGHTMTWSALGDLPMRGAALGDLDGDGDLDVFGAVLAPRPGREGSPGGRVLLNDGQGSFSDSGQRLGKDESLAVALGDLDGDGDLDALVGTATGAVVWINQGGAQGGAAGTFAASGQAITGGPATAVFLADLNGNGRLDALVGGTQRATIWWNDGQAQFTRSNQNFRYSERHALALGDFNSDGQIDIFAGAYAATHTVWLNLGNGWFQHKLW